MKTILWISKHVILQAEIRELEKLFGNIRIIQVNTKIRDAEHVRELMKMYNADELVAILPLSIIRALCESGIYPLYAEMEKIHVCNQQPCPEFDYTRDWIEPTTKKHYRFKKFWRIKEVKLVLEEIQR